MSKAARARVGLGLEIVAFAMTLAIVLVLMQDARATSLHVSSLMFALVVSASPPVLSVVGTRGAVAIDAVACLLLVTATLGCFTIGGLVLFLPALLLIAAGGMHHVVSPQGVHHAKAVSTAFIVVGIVLFLGGLLTMSVGMVVAPVGLLLIAWGARGTGGPRVRSTDGAA